MKQLIAAAATIVFVTFAHFTSGASAPSPESIEKLLIVTKADKMIDSVMQSMEGMLSSMGDKMRPAGEDTPRGQSQSLQFNEKNVTNHERRIDLRQNEINVFADLFEII